MAYTSGVASSVNDMVVALSNFLVTQGWGLTAPWAEMSAGVATGNTMSAVTDPNGSVFAFSYTASALMLNTVTGIDASKVLYAQPGANMRNLAISPIAGPYVGYYFFTDGIAVNAAIELVPNVFTHLNFGTVTKNGVWAGGQYVSGLHQDNLSVDLMAGQGNGYPFKSFNADGTNQGYAMALMIDQGFMRQGIAATGWADFASSGQFVNQLIGQYTTQVNPVLVNSAAVVTMGQRLLRSSPNGFNDRAVLLPVILSMSSVGAGGGSMYQIGCVPNVAMLNIRDLEPKAVINNEWMVFPLSQKNGNGSSYMNSSNFGIAYKK